MFFLIWTIKASYSHHSYHRAHIYMYVCMHVCVFICTCACMCVCLYVRVHACVCVYMYARRASTHTCMHTYTLKLYVSFAKEPCKRDYILQKRRVILRSLICTQVERPKLLAYFHKNIGLFCKRAP